MTRANHMTIGVNHLSVLWFGLIRSDIPYCLGGSYGLESLSQGGAPSQLQIQHFV